MKYSILHCYPFEVPLSDTPPPFLSKNQLPPPFSQFLRCPNPSLNNGGEGTNKAAAGLGR